MRTARMRSIFSFTCATFAWPSFLVWALRVSMAEWWSSRAVSYTGSNGSSCATSTCPCSIRITASRFVVAVCADCVEGVAGIFHQPRMLLLRSHPLLHKPSPLSQLRRLGAHDSLERNLLVSQLEKALPD
eukprot:m.828253 g.828253  ORF g.828253 m.828253 type:complete len:130 (-) comp59436_c0_seq1:2746-3135(-)